MDERLIDFVTYVRAHSGITSAKVAEYFGVSVRTVRNWLHDANDALDGAASIVSVRGAYSLTIRSRTRYERLTAAGNSIWSRTPSTSDRRVAYLLSNLLFRSDWVTIDALAEELYVTRRTVSTSLRDVERELAAYGLWLKRRSHHGICVQGDELARRRCLAQMISLNADLTRNVFDSGRAVMGDTTVGELATSVRDVLAKHGVSLSSGGFRGLMVHLCIVLGRAGGGYRGELDKDMRQGVRSSWGYPVAQDIVTRSAELSGNALNEADVAYMVLCLMSLRGVSQEGLADSSYLADAMPLAAKALVQIDGQFRMKLSEDTVVRGELAARLAPLIIRLRFGVDRGTALLLDNARHTYPLAYEMGAVTAKVVSTALDIAVPDEELGMLTLYYACVLERPTTQAVGLRVLLVGEYGLDGARLLRERFGRGLGAHALQLAVQSFAQLTKEDLAETDVIVSSVDLTEDIMQPVVSVSAFPSEAEIAHARLALARMP